MGMLCMKLVIMKVLRTHLSILSHRTFLEHKDVKAVVSIACCYNLLSEGCLDADKCDFPMSCGVKSSGISLGKSSRDLTCQNADRWRSLEKDAGLHSFELHAFRAAFQMVHNIYNSLKSFGQGLLDVLQSMSPSDHETMQIVEEATFDALQRLSKKMVALVFIEMDMMLYTQSHSICKHHVHGLRGNEKES